MIVIAGVDIKNLQKRYQVGARQITVFDGLNMNLAGDRITVVLGRSGCGKTTLLRILMGLEEKDGGEIRFDGLKKMGVVFQEPRLMPWLTVSQNILFGVPKKRQRRCEKELTQEELTGLLELTGLREFADARPEQLSGGMKQRAALARALAYDASYLLMDEPFAALDYFTRQSMQQELLKIHRQRGTGVLFVTHSIDEALILGNEIFILDGGKIAASYEPGSHEEPRDLLSGNLIEIKRNIIKTMF